jgi:prephenate dehydrogenase
LRAEAPQFESIALRDPRRERLGYRKATGKLLAVADASLCGYGIMKHWDTVAIVGVGLIGGSIGLALRQRKLAGKVIGIGRRPESLQKAIAAKAVDQTSQDLAAGVRNAELIVVCTPVKSIPEHVRQAAAACPAGALLTDAGSTKATIVRQLNGALRRSVAFVGSHPLAGSEKTGCEFSRADLFDGRVVVVTPTRKTGESNLQRAADFWSALGASVMIMSPAAHDRALAATSHLPHLIAAALARSTAEADRPLTAGGWRDGTRIAAGEAELWSQILSDNADNVLKALDRFEKSLAAFRSALERGNHRRLNQMLTEAKQIRDAVGS